jgi:hypothetical protein
MASGDQQQWQEVVDFEKTKSKVFKKGADLRLWKGGVAHVTV